MPREVDTQGLGATATLSGFAMNVPASPAPATPLAEYKIIQRWLQRFTGSVAAAAPEKFVQPSATKNDAVRVPDGSARAVEIEEVGDWFPIWFIVYEGGDWVPHHTGYHATPNDAQRHIEYLMSGDRSKGDPPPVLRVPTGAYKVSARRPGKAKYASKELREAARVFAKEQRALGPAPSVQIPYLTFLPGKDGGVIMLIHEDTNEALEAVRAASAGPRSPSPPWQRPHP